VRARQHVHAIPRSYALSIPPVEWSYSSTSHIYRDEEREDTRSSNSGKRVSKQVAMCVASGRAKTHSCSGERNSSMPSFSYGCHESASRSHQATAAHKILEISCRPSWRRVARKSASASVHAACCRVVAQLAALDFAYAEGVLRGLAPTGFPAGGVGVKTGHGDPSPTDTSDRFIIAPSSTGMSGFRPGF